MQWAAIRRCNIGRALTRRNNEGSCLFRELIQRAYVQDLLLFQNPDFVYNGQRLIDGGAVVDTKIVTPKDEFDVKYALVPAGDKWMPLRSQSKA
jgi:hypothetical protein